MDQTAMQLTTHQQFELERMKRAAEGMSREQAIDLLLQASELLMRKDNIIKSLCKESHANLQSHPI